MLASDLSKLLAQIIKEKGNLPIYLFKESGILVPVIGIDPKMKDRIFVFRTKVEGDMHFIKHPIGSPASDPSEMSLFSNKYKFVVTEEFIDDMIVCLESDTERIHIDLATGYYIEKINALSTGKESFNVGLYTRFVNFLWRNENNFRKFYTEEEICKSPILSLIWK